MADTTCLTFQPSEADFSNFYHYLNMIHTAHPDIGLCKIIPPKSFKARDNYQLDKINFEVEKPISQEVSGRSGAYSVHLTIKKTVSIQKFVEDVKKKEYKEYEHDYKERERQFWRSLNGTSGFGDPIYGADVMGTLFTEDCTHNAWNLNSLENLLNLIKIRMPGVNTPMVYVGSWRAMFCYHVEDMDLYSINFLHCGANKSWYSIPPSGRKRFEGLMQSYFPEDYRNCKEYLRHKTSIISPHRLREHNIPFVTALQAPGEFIVTFPGAYHAGFNHGFNIAEATNFAFERWFRLGRYAMPCNCRPTSVAINVDELETVFLREKNKIRKTGGNSHALLAHNPNALIPQAATATKASTAPDCEPDYFNSQQDRIRCDCSMNFIPQQYSVSSEKTLRPLDASQYFWIDGIPLTYSPNVEDYYLQCCTECELYYHPQCIKQYGDLFGYDCSFLQQKICRICYFIDTSDVYYIGNAKKRKYRKRNDPNSQSASTSSSVAAKTAVTGGRSGKIAREDLYDPWESRRNKVKLETKDKNTLPRLYWSEEQQEEHSPGLEMDNFCYPIDEEENSVLLSTMDDRPADEYAKVKQKRGKSLASEIKVGDLVRVQLPAFAKPSIGRIEAIDNGWGRFHIQNSFRGEDPWIRLREFEKITCLEEEKEEDYYPPRSILPGSIRSTEAISKRRSTKAATNVVMEGSGITYFCKEISYPVTVKESEDRFRKILQEGTSFRSPSLTMMDKIPKMHLASDVIFVNHYYQQRSSLNNSTRLRLGRQLTYQHLQFERRKSKILAKERKLQLLAAAAVTEKDPKEEKEEEKIQEMPENERVETIASSAALQSSIGAQVELISVEGEKEREDEKRRKDHEKAKRCLDIPNEEEEALEEDGAEDYCDNDDDYDYDEEEDEREDEEVVSLYSDDEGDTMSIAQSEERSTSAMEEAMIVDLTDEPEETNNPSTSSSCQEEKKKKKGEKASSETVISLLDDDDEEEEEKEGGSALFLKPIVSYSLEDHERIFKKGKVNMLILH